MRLKCLRGAHWTFSASGSVVNLASRLTEGFDTADLKEAKALLEELK